MTNLSSTVPAPSPGVDPLASARPDYRAERFAARHWLWHNSTATRTTTSTDDDGVDRRYDHVARHRLCGRIAASREAGITVRVKPEGDGRSAGWGGLQSCGSVWVCPVCSAKIAHERQQSIAEVITEWVRRGFCDDASCRHDVCGGRVIFATFTMRHSRGQRCATLWDSLSRAWHAVASGRAWAASQQLVGTVVEREVKSGARAGQLVAEHRVPVVRVTESTVGPNGWHLHVHALLFVHRDSTADQLAAVGWGMWDRWRSALVRAGLDAPGMPGGFDWREVTGTRAADVLGDYFTKAVYRASAEVARGDMKRARSVNRTPMQVLRDLVATSTGEVFEAASDAEVMRLLQLDRADDVGTWEEWERASRGRRQVEGLGRFRAMLGLGEVRTDQQIADDSSGAGEVAVTVPADVHARIVSARADLLVLRAWESSDAAGWAVLARFGMLADVRGVTEPVPVAARGPS